MNPLNLKNNALFLSCWYERSRPVQLICFSIMILSILLLSFLNVSIHEKDIEKVLESLFYVIVWIQALVLLVQATMFASHMGSRERTSETLDFHRNSPQPVKAKVIGLIFGSTWFEWAIFCVLFILELPFALLPKVTLSQILFFNVSLILSAVFFHTTAATVSLLSTQKKRGGSLFLLLLFIWFGGPMFFYYLSTSSSAFFSHVLGLAAFRFMYPEQLTKLNGRFYTFELPLLLMQVITQLPLFLLMVRGMTRIFRLPNSPAWSKVDVLRFCGFVFFLITGFFLADFNHLGEILASEDHRFYPHTPDGFFRHEAYLFTFLFVLIGVMISFFSVPSYFKCSKYAVLTRKGLIRSKAIFDDGATSLFTILCYVGMGGVFLMPYLLATHCSPGQGAASFFILTSYVLAFAGFLEFFKLGRFRNNKIFIVTVMLVWWIFIPWLITLAMNFNFCTKQIYATAISPFWGFGYAISLLLGEVPPEPFALLVPGVVAALMWGLAWQEHILVKKQSGG
jgi:hypothetical protein